MKKKTNITENTEKQIWIIGIGGSNADDVEVQRVYGTKEQIKQHLLALVQNEKDSWSETWEYGTETIDGIEERTPEHLYAYACFSDFHTDFSASLEQPPKTL